MVFSLMAWMKALISSSLNCPPSLFFLIRSGIVIMSARSKNITSLLRPKIFESFSDQDLVLLIVLCCVLVFPFSLDFKTGPKKLRHKQSRLTS